MSVYLLITLSLVILLCYIRFRRLVTPISLVAVWWLGWAIVSQYSLSGVEAPSPAVSAMVIVMIGSFTLGALFVSRPRIGPGAEAANERFVANSENIVFPVSVILMIFFVYLFWIVRGTSGGSDGSIGRSEAIQAIQGLTIFGQYTYIILEFLIMGLTTLFLVLAPTALVRGRLRFFGVVVLLSFLSTLAPRNRFPLYVIIVLAISLYLVAGKLKRIRRRTAAVSGLFVFFGVGAVILSRTVERHQRDTESLSEKLSILAAHGLEYHTVGFQLMTLELEAPDSLANTRLTYGRCSIGGLEDIWFWLVWVHVNKEYQPAGMINFKYRNEFVDVGSYDSTPVRANAFYTVLHTLYLDGRWYAVALFPAIFGALFARRYWRLRASGSDYDLAWMSFYFYIAFFSLFQSPIEESRVWSAMGYLWLLPRVGLGFRAVNSRTTGREKEVSTEDVSQDGPAESSPKEPVA